MMSAITSGLYVKNQRVIRFITPKFDICKFSGKLEDWYEFT